MNPPSNNTHWANIKEAGSSRGISLLLACYRAGGKTLFRVLLAPAMVYFFLTKHEARRHSMSFLRRVHRARGTAPSHLWWQSFNHFWSFAEALLDKFAVWMGDITRADLDVTNKHLIGEMLAAGRGGILLISHLGNFELCRCLSQDHPDMRLTLLMHTKHSEKFNRVFKRVSNAERIEVMQVTEITPATAMALQERVGRGEFVAIAADRVGIANPDKCLWVDFMNSPAPLPYGPFILAAILKCPILSVFCVRNGSRFNVEFATLKGDGHYPRHERDAMLQTLAKEYASQLQAQCLAYPLQWFNFFDFWHQVPLPYTNSAESRL